MKSLHYVSPEVKAIANDVELFLPVVAPCERKSTQNDDSVSVRLFLLLRCRILKTNVVFRDDLFVTPQTRNSDCAVGRKHNLQMSTGNQLMSAWMQT